MSGTPTLARIVKAKLALDGRSLLDLSERSGIEYGRLVQLLRGFREPRPGELRRIVQTLSTPEETAR